MNDSLRPSPFLFNHDRKKKYGSATWNMEKISRVIKTQCRDMPQTAFIVWFSLLEWMVGNNHIDKRLKAIAEDCNLSVATVQRAMKYFEDHDLLARKSLPHQVSVWVVNPELVWNSRHEDHPQAVVRYHKLSRENRDREKQKNPIETTKNEELAQNYDKLDEAIKGDELCESKLRVPLPLSGFCKS